MEATDLAAVERTRGGDTAAFRVLVERYGRSVFRLAFRMTGNEFDAEDVVQETFLRAFKQLDSYESRSSFGTWLYRIAANYSLDLIRSRKRHAARHVADTAERGRCVRQRENQRSRTGPGILQLPGEGSASMPHCNC